MKKIEALYKLEEKNKHLSNVFTEKNISVMNLQLKANEEIAPHNGNYDVLVIVRKGQVRFDIEGEDVLLTHFDVLYMEPMEMHGLVAVEDTDLIVVKMNV